MRTTVTLDPDVENLLKEQVHTQRKSFKVILNNAIRQGLRPQRDSKKAKPFVVEACSMGIVPGIDPTRFTELAGDMEVDAFLELTKRLEKKRK